MINMKSKVIAASGITIGEHLVIPDAMVPLTARVEIGAKRAAGYFS
jgi:hypothetical protein